MKPYCVTWNPGNFGHLIKAIIGQEVFQDDIKNLGDDTHGYEHDQIDVVHEYDREKINTSQATIKPFFGHKELKFFPFYLNYRKNNFECGLDDFVNTYWNFREPLCDVSFNIDLTNFFNDTPTFINDICLFLKRESISNETRNLINIKKEANIEHYHNFVENVSSKKPTGTNLERALWICHSCNGNYDEARKLIKQHGS